MEKFMKKKTLFSMRNDCFMMEQFFFSLCRIKCI